MIVARSLAMEQQAGAEKKTAGFREARR